MTSFNDFIHKYKLKNKATSSIKFYQILCSIGLSDVGIFSGDGPIQSHIVIVNWHPSKGTHWAVYINQNYFDSYGCAPGKLSKLIIKRNRLCLYSEYKIQGLTSKKRFLLCKLLFIYTLPDKSVRY